MTITKQRPRSLRFTETFQTAELSLKRKTVTFTAARELPELATTLEKLNCFHSEHRRGYQTKLLTDRSKGGRLTVEVRFAEMTGDRHYSELAHSPCKFSMLLFGQLLVIFVQLLHFCCLQWPPCRPCLLQTNSSFSLRLSEPERTFIFGTNSSKCQSKNRDWSAFI